MASSVDLYKARTLEAPSSLKRPLKPSKEHVAQTLVGEVFLRFAAGAAVGGGGAVYTKMITHLEESDYRTDDLTRPRPSILERRELNRCSPLEREYLVQMIQEHPFNGDMTLIQVLCHRMIDNWNQLELAGGLPSECSIKKEDFFFSLWQAMYYLELINQKLPPNSAAEYCSHNLFINLRQYILFLQTTIRELRKVTSPNPHIQHLLQDTTILLKLLYEEDCSATLLKGTRVRFFAESPPKPTSFSDLRPLIDSSVRFLEILERKMRSDNAPSSLSSFKKLYLRASHLMEELVSSPHNQEETVRALYLCYRDSCDQPAKEESAQQQLVRRMHLSHKMKSCAEATHRLIAIEHCADIFNHVALILHFTYAYPLYPLVFRIGTTTTALSLEAPPQPLSLSAFPSLSKILHQCSELTLFAHMSPADFRQTYKRFNAILANNREQQQLETNFALQTPAQLSDLSQQLSAMLEVSQEQTAEILQKASSDPMQIIPNTLNFSSSGEHVILTALPQQFSICIDLLPCADPAHLAARLKEIVRMTRAAVSKLPAQHLTKELQELIRDSFFKVLWKLPYEYLLLRDLQRLIRLEQHPIEDLFPAELLELLCFEVPGVVEDSSDEEEEALSDAELPETTSSELQTPAKEVAPIQELSRATSSVAEAVLRTPFPQKRQERRKRSSIQPAAAATAPSDPRLELIDELRHSKKYRDTIRVLRKLGLTSAGQRGSHEKFVSEQGGQVIVPRHAQQDIPRGTAQSIAKQASAALE